MGRLLAQVRLIAAKGAEGISAVSAFFDGSSMERYLIVEITTHFHGHGVTAIETSDRNAAKLYCRNVAGIAPSVLSSSCQDHAV